MSSKTAAESAMRRRAWSLAARLTAWYAGSSFALILAATGFLYWALAASLDRQADESLGDEMRVLRAALQHHPDDSSTIRWEAEEEGQARQHTQLQVRITDGAGMALYETPGMGRLLPPDAFPAPAAEPGAGIEYRSPEGRSFRVMAVAAEEAGPQTSPVIQVAMDRTAEARLLADYRRNLAGVLGVALVVCAATGYRIARRGMRPVHDITAIARQTGPANLGERIDPAGLPAELLTLADTFNRMLDRLGQSFDRLSRFSADIAHELRTPLHNLRGEAELALRRSRTPDEYREVLASNLEEYDRLSRMVESLLFLARAENPKTQVTRERFDVGEELGAVCEFCEAAATQGGVRLAVAAGGPLPAELNRSLFGRAVGNVVTNALDHTPPGGSVTVSADGHGDRVTVTVADTGCGIPAEHLPHVFDRFYRADTARAAGGGVGLGLAIVRSIVELHGGSVEVASQVGHGTCVTLTFPNHPTAPQPGPRDGPPG
jgi:two-component system heavy metal sensor histidine kinase CusS